MSETPFLKLPPQIATFAKYGVKMIPCYDDGRPALRWSNKNFFTNDIDDIQTWWRKYPGEGNYRMFAFEPAMCGLFVLDLDRKNGVDGVAGLQKAIDKIGFGKSVDNFPVKTTTPNDGLHFYFKYSGDESFPPNRKNPPLPAGVEVKHTGCLVTVPGSVKNGVRYHFTGSLDQAPELPEELINLLCKPILQPKQTYSQDPSTISLSLEAIEVILEGQGEYPNKGNRNNYCFQFARFARKKGYSESEVIDYLRIIVDGFDTPEVNGIYAVRSAFKRRQ